jgi:hypothetical protein
MFQPEPFDSSDGEMEGNAALMPELVKLRLTHVALP